MSTQQEVFFLKDKDGFYVYDPSSIWLHFEELKFWELSVKEFLKTVIRVGKLLDLETEIPEEKQIEKFHESEQQLVEYVEKHVKSKLQKGYKLNVQLQKQSFRTLEDWQIQKRNLIKKKDFEKEEEDDFSAEDEDEQNLQFLQKKVKQDEQGGGGGYRINLVGVGGDKSVLNDNFKVQDFAQLKGNQLQLPGGGGRGQSKLNSFGSRVSLSDLTDESVSRNCTPVYSTHSSDGGQTKLGKGCSGSMELMLAFDMQKVERDDFTGWLMSEKLDGIRCFWNGSQMYSRNGNRFFCPKWFVEKWPRCCLDGELWTKREHFQKIVSIVKKKDPVDEDWRNFGIKFMVFDAPTLNKPFKQRYEIFKKEIEDIQAENLVVLPQIECEGEKQILEQLEQVLQKGGEGLMLKDPQSQYEGKRSKSLVKVKQFNDDEAEVVDIIYDYAKGNHLMSAILCKNSAGTEFKIGGGFDLEWRRNPPKRGTKVTYKYQNLSNNGKPRFPIFLRVYEGI